MNFWNISWDIAEQSIAFTKKSLCQWLIQRDLEAGIPAWAPKCSAQKGFLVPYILDNIHKDK